MKTLKIVRGIGAVALVVLAIFVMPNLLPKNNKNLNNKSILGGEERESYNDAAKYIFSLRVNQSTGRVDIGEVEAARQGVEDLISGNQTARTQSSTLDLNWQELGPDNIGGRTRAILFSRTHPDSMWAGGVSGGLWRSSNHGLSWYKVNDAASNLCVSCIFQTADGSIYYGTGNGFDSYGGPNGDLNSGFYGQGVWKSTDGGVTFNQLPSTWANLTTAGKANWDFVNNLAADPTNPLRIYAATHGGLFKSDDGGNTWGNPVTIGSSHVTGFAQTVKVGSDGTVVCSINTSSGNFIFRSPTGDSTTFTRLTTNLPGTTNAYRIEIAIAPSNPNVMYAVAVNGFSDLLNIFRSTDKFDTVSIIGPGGGSFDPFNVEQGQGYYDCAIAVAPNNQDKIFVVGVTPWKWQLDSGWTQMCFYDYPVHADMHTVVFNPSNPSEFFIGTDGGLYETPDQGLNFAERNNLYSVTQYYACASSFVQGEFAVIGGTQDNGTLALTGTGNNPQDAFAILGADGFNVAASFYNPLAFFAETYEGAMGRSSSGAGGGALFYDSHVDGTPAGQPDSAGRFYEFAPFNTPYLLWENTRPNTPMDTSFFLAKASSVWMTKSALNFSVTPKWYRVFNFSPSFFGGGSGPVCMACTNDGNTLFLGIEAPNKLYRISNLNYVNNNLDTSGLNYNLTTLSTPIISTSLSYLGAGQVVTSISVDPANNNHVVVTLGNYGSPYGNGNISIHVIQTNNALSATPTWTNITPTPNNSTIAIDMPCYSSIIDRWNPNIILIGTELGLFATNDGGTTWTYQDQMPRVPVFMIKQVAEYTNGTPAEDIYVATHGRGVWKSSTLTGINNINASNKLQVNIYPNPTQDVANINYTMTQPANVLLDIYNIQGQKVKSLNLGTQASGAHTYSVNLSGIASGTYIMNAIIGEDKSVSKFVIAR